MKCTDAKCRHAILMHEHKQHLSANLLQNANIAAASYCTRPQGPHYNEERGEEVRQKGWRETGLELG